MKVRQRRVLALTPEIHQRLADVERAASSYVPGGESASVVELPKLALADALLNAIAEQTGSGVRWPIRATFYQPKKRT